MHRRRVACLIFFVSNKENQGTMQDLSNDPPLRDSIVYRAKKHFAAKQPNAVERSAMEKWFDKRAAKERLVRARRTVDLRIARRCRNDVDLALNPLTPGQQTFRLQQGQCLTLRDAVRVWMIAQEMTFGVGGHVRPKNPYTQDPIDAQELYDWIMEMIFQTASLSLLDEWLQKTMKYVQSELVQDVRAFQGDVGAFQGTDERSGEWYRYIKQHQDELFQMINISEQIFIAVQQGRALPHLKREAWYIIRNCQRDGVGIDIIEEFWKYNEGNYEFVYGVETARVRQMPDNLLDG